MSAEVFVDTNVLVYALSDSPDPRHAQARSCVSELWREAGRAAISVQVLQELHVNLMRKAGLSAAESTHRIEPFFAWIVIDNDRALLRDALDVQARHQLSFWDCLIVAAAQRAGASELWSEDLGHGRLFEQLRVINPFR